MKINHLAVPKQELSCKAREILEHAAGKQLEALRKLHWAAVGFMGNAKKEWVGNLKIIENIAQETRDVEAAIKEMNRAYTAQFKDGRKSLYGDDNS